MRMDDFDLEVGFRREAAFEKVIGEREGRGGEDRERKALDWRCQFCLPC